MTEDERRDLRIKLRHELEGAKYGWFLPNFSLIRKLEKKLTKEEIAEIRNYI